MCENITKTLLPWFCVLRCSKFTQTNKVGCHLPPYRAAVAGIWGYPDILLLLYILTAAGS